MRKPEEVLSNGRVSAIVTWWRWITQIVLIPLLGLAFALWLNHETRLDDIEKGVAVMEGNRFTSADGKEVWSALADLESTKANRADVPPPEVIQFMRRIDNRLDKIEDQMLELIKANGGKK